MPKGLKSVRVLIDVGKKWEYSQEVEKMKRTKENEKVGERLHQPQPYSSIRNL